MVNFEKIVQNLLLKEDVVGVPLWFQQLLNKHKDLFGQEVNDEDLSDFFELLDDAQISEQEGLKDLSKIRILDIMKTFYDMMTPKPKDLNEFKDQISTDTTKKFEKIASPFIALNNNNKSNWKPTNKKIQELEQKSKNLLKQKSSASLSSFGNLSLIGAVQEMIKRRVSVATSLAGFQNPRSPFSNLINDVFSYPEQYKSGQKKYTSDFDAVDKFDIDKLIDIALAAKEFFVSEMSKYKTGQLQAENLKIFHSLVEQILSEAGNQIEIKNINKQNFLIVKDASGKILFQKPEQTVLKTAQKFDPKITSLNQLKTKGEILSKVMSSKQRPQPTPTPTLQTKKQAITLPPETINRLEDDVSERLNFLSGKPVQFSLVDIKTGKDDPKQIKTTPTYTVNKILNLSKPEFKNAQAQKLVNLLNSVADYTKSKVGTGERLQQLTQAAGSLARLGGASLYG
jgi:hypothetical protein